jgi:hypothetical protein
MSGEGRCIRVAFCTLEANVGELRQGEVLRIPTFHTPSEEGQEQPDALRRAPRQRDLLSPTRHPFGCDPTYKVFSRTIEQREVGGVGGIRLGPLGC